MVNICWRVDGAGVDGVIGGAVTGGAEVPYGLCTIVCGWPILEGVGVGCTNGIFAFGTFGGIVGTLVGGIVETLGGGTEIVVLW